jgi:MFS family permease
MPKSLSHPTEAAAYYGSADPTLTASGLPAPESIVRNRNFLALWVAQALTQTAQNAIFYGLIVFIEERSGSSTQTGLLILSTIVPAILFGIAAGVYVDRTSKKNVLIVSNLLRGIAALTYLFFGHTLIVIFIVNFFFSIISQFFGPAEAATIPLLVRRDQLITANGLFNLTFTGSQLAGFVVLGPPLVKIFGSEALFGVVAAAYFVATVLCWLLPVREPARESPTRSPRIVEDVLREVQDGVDLLRGDRRVSLSLVHLVMAATLMLVTGMLAPGFVNRVLGIRPEDAVFVLAPAGVGIALGTVALPRLVQRYFKFDLINVGLVGMAASLVALGFSPYLWSFLTHGVGFFIRPESLPEVFSLVTMVMVIAFLLGLTFAMVNVPAQTALMENAPAEMRGRLFAVQLVFGSLVSVLPLLFLGQLADQIGISQVVVLIGLAVGGLAVYSFRQTRQIKAEMRGQAPAHPRPGLSVD